MDTVKKDNDVLKLGRTPNPFRGQRLEHDSGSMGLADIGPIQFQPQTRLQRLGPFEAFFNPRNLKLNQTHNTSKNQPNLTHKCQVRLSNQIGIILSGRKNWVFFKQFKLIIQKFIIISI